MNPYYADLEGLEWGGMSPVGKNFYNTGTSYTAREGTKSITAITQQPSMYVSPDDELKFNVRSTASNPNAVIADTPKMSGIQKPRNSEIKTDGGTAEKPKYTEDQVVLFGRSASYLVSAASDFANASLSWDAAKMKKNNYEFAARQSDRMADLLYKNIKDINRAAQMDANLYKIQAKETKAKQTTAMAASGFAVGKGVYKTTLETTDARTNYNIAMKILKAELESAEVTRKIGTYRAQAEIERGNAKISEIMGRAEMQNKIIGGIGNLVNAGVNYSIGKWGLSGATEDSATKSKTNSGGKK